MEIRKLQILEVVDRAIEPGTLRLSDADWIGGALTEASSAVVNQ